MEAAFSVSKLPRHFDEDVLVQAHLVKDVKALDRLI